MLPTVLVRASAAESGPGPDAGALTAPASSPSSRREAAPRRAGERLANGRLRPESDARGREKARTGEAPGDTVARRTPGAEARCAGGGTEE